MKTLILLGWAAVLLIVPLAFAQETEKVEPSAAEAKKFAGTWRVVSMTRDGMEIPHADFDKVELIFADDQYTYISQTAQRDQGTFKLDVNKKPHVIVTTKADDVDKGKAVKRTYEWKDNDTLTFVTPGPGEDLPKEFKAPKGSGREIAVWKRDKTKPK
jgi:uncharacterized protein (TIGR03067 family)